MALGRLINIGKRCLGIVLLMLFCHCNSVNAVTLGANFQGVVFDEIRPLVVPGYETVMGAQIQFAKNSDLSQREFEKMVKTYQDLYQFVMDKSVVFREAIIEASRRGTQNPVPKAINPFHDWKAITIVHEDVMFGISSEQEGIWTGKTYTPAVDQRPFRVDGEMVYPGQRTGIRIDADAGRGSPVLLSISSHFLEPVSESIVSISKVQPGLLDIFDGELQQTRIDFEFPLHTFVHEHYHATKINAGREFPIDLVAIETGASRQRVSLALEAATIGLVEEGPYNQNSVIRELKKHYPWMSERFYYGEFSSSDLHQVLLDDGSSFEKLIQQWMQSSREYLRSELFKEYGSERMSRMTANQINLEVTRRQRARFFGEGFVASFCGSSSPFFKHNP